MQKSNHKRAKESVCWQILKLLTLFFGKGERGIPGLSIKKKSYFPISVTSTEIGDISPFF